MTICKFQVRYNAKIINKKELIIRINSLLQVKIEISDNPRIEDIITKVDTSSKEIITIRDTNKEDHNSINEIKPNKVINNKDINLLRKINKTGKEEINKEETNKECLIKAGIKADLKEWIKVDLNRVKVLDQEILNNRVVLIDQENQDNKQCQEMRTKDQRTDHTCQNHP